MSFKDRLLEAEKHLSVYDPILAGIIKQFGPCLLKPHRDFYGELVSSIVGQQLSTQAAAFIWLRMLQIFDGKMPEPRQLIEFPDERLRACGLSRPKISYVKDLAMHVLDGRLDLEHISRLPNEQVITQLTAVKGIGEWSAHMFMIFSLGRLDVLPAGDLGIRKAIALHYKLDSLPDPAMSVSIAAKNKWHPYESVAAWYLWKSLDASPDKMSRHNV